MKTLIIVLDFVLLAPTLFYSLYLAFLTLLALLRNLRTFNNNNAKIRRFAILVPAHNEELVIDKTISSLKNIDYPQDLYDIIVIADNCSDNTAPLSAQKGVNVMERSDKTRLGKGYALRWCLDQIASKRKAYDAFVVIDADSVVSSNFLSVMDAYLEEGAECIQCSDLVVPQPGTWSPEMTRVAFILHNYVRPLGKLSIGCSAGLNGNGMCFSGRLVETMPWNTYSRVEDLERYLSLALDGIKVQFAPEAVVYAIMPSTPKNAESQRRRWEIGRFPIIAKYAGPMITAALSKRSIMIFEAFIDLITPAFLNLSEITIASFVLNLAAFASGASWLAGLSLAWGSALLLQFFHVFGGLRAAHADSDAYKALLNTPKYALWKLRLYFKTILKGDDKAWIRTAREESK